MADIITTIWLILLVVIWLTRCKIPSTGLTCSEPSFDLSPSTHQSTQPTMAAISKRQVASLLHERRRAMDGYRFKPENYHEIQRVLGSRYAPDLNRVVSKHRANAASAYLRRLHRDVERSQGGYYDQLQTIPLQIRWVAWHRQSPPLPLLSHQHVSAVRTPQPLLSHQRMPIRKDDPQS